MIPKSFNGVGEMEVLAISLGELVGACGTDGFRCVWNLKMLRRTVHEGAIAQAFGEVLNSRFESSILDNKPYDKIAYMRPDSAAMDRPDVRLQTQLEGVLLSVASHYHSEQSKFDLLPLWPKAIARHATGIAKASDAEYHDAAKQNGIIFTSPRVSAAYWIREAALKELQVTAR